MTKGKNLNSIKRIKLFFLSKTKSDSYIVASELIVLTWWVLLCFPFPIFLSRVFRTFICTISHFVDVELSFQLKGQGPLQGEGKKDCEEVELVTIENIKKVLKPRQEGLKEQTSHMLLRLQFFPFLLDSIIIIIRWREIEGDTDGNFTKHCKLELAGISLVDHNQLDSNYPLYKFWKQYITQFCILLLIEYLVGDIFNWLLILNQHSIEYNWI